MSTSNEPLLPVVLLVEDHADTAEVMRAGLLLFGFEVVVATCGLDVITLAKGRQFHAMVCDLGLPDIDGRDLLPIVGVDPNGDEAVSS